MCRELGSSGSPTQEIWCHSLGQFWKHPVRELHSFPAGEESGHNKACCNMQAIPDPNFLWQLIALSTKISFKSQIFQLCVGSNGIVGNMNLHNLFYHQAFTSYTLKKNQQQKKTQKYPPPKKKTQQNQTKNTKPTQNRRYKCYKSDKNQDRQILISLAKIEPKMPS